MLNIADTMDDLLADFLRQFGLDEVPSVVKPACTEDVTVLTLNISLARTSPRPTSHPLARARQLGREPFQMNNPITIIEGTERRLPVGMWAQKQDSGTDPGRGLGDFAWQPSCLPVAVQVNWAPRPSRVPCA
jgi:hypothetical protein